MAFEATVAFIDNTLHNLNLQDGSDGIFVRIQQDEPLEPGDRVLVEGHLEPSFLPFLVATRIVVLHHGLLPAPLPVTFDDLVRTRIVSARVKLCGRIRSANLVNSTTMASGRLEMQVDGGYADVEVESHDLAAMRALVDSDVEVTGIAARKFDSKMQQTGVRLRVSSLADIRVLNSAPTDPWALPASPLGFIITAYHIHDLSSRLRVQGTLTYFDPGVGAVLQSGRQSLWIETDSTDPLRIGNMAEAIGFPDVHDGHLALTHTELRDSGASSSVVPFAAHWNELAEWARNRPSGLSFDLVSTEGRVVSLVRAADQDEYVLDSEGKLFSAIYHHPVPPLPVPAFRAVPEGSLVRVTGICMPTDSQPYNGEVHFNILLRTPADVALIGGPPFWSMKNLVAAVALLTAVLMLIGTWAWMLERRIRRQTAALAYIERRRRSILEDINAMQPLADIVEMITGIVTFQLHGAPCWCTIAGGATLGNRPRKCDGMRVVERAIPARSGGKLGSLHVAFPASARPLRDEEEALSMGAGLVAVAIESRRLYTDLLHRSEFDQLTEIYNRFSLDMQLDATITSARERGSVFALIYVDLDNFKLVNDRHGHQIGDLYLREAAVRMKDQLRPSDQLARLGGDEFAALVTNVRNRSEVEEVAERLERTLAEPFVFGQIRLSGSASTGIALYPEDATAKDGLLHHADRAMYATKATRPRLSKAG